MEGAEPEPTAGLGLGAAFYCVADARYFPGAVALVNSLRLVGHHEPIHLLDCGLTAQQRLLLEPEVEIIAGAGTTPPWLLKTVAPLERPAAVVALLDTDIVVTNSLEALLAKAATTGLVAFENPVDRYVAGWGALLDLGSQRRRRYASSAAIFAERGLAREVLGLMQDRQRLVDFELTYWRRNVPGYAFTFADQDVFNAILASRVPSSRVSLLDQRLAATPPFDGLRLLDRDSLRCAYEDAVEPYLVHHHTVKPWLEPTHHGVYSELLSRLLVGEDLAIRIPEDQVPLRLRTGPLAYAARKRINAGERFRWHVREPLRRATRRSAEP